MIQENNFYLKGNNRRKLSYGNQGQIIDILSVHSDLENANQYLHENDDLNKLNMNSISFIKMVVAIESEFNFEFEDEALDYNRFTSLNSLCNYVEEQMRLNNVIYTPDEGEKVYNGIRKEIVIILSQHSSNPIVSQPAFNDLLDLHLSSIQIEKIIRSINEKFNVVLEINFIERERLFLIDNLCKYLQDNT